MKYFESFPKIAYTFNKNTINQQLVTDILARTAFLSSIADNVDIGYEYNIKESDTPEIIAHKVYGDPQRHWIVLLYNKIMNPMYDFPMKSDALDSYIANKYGQTIDQARSTIHHYEKIIRKVSVYQGAELDRNEEKYILTEYDVDFSDNSITPAALPSTADTSIVVNTETVNYTGYVLTITTIHSAVSNYTYEFEVNESKRKIRILDAKYVPQVEEQFKGLMSNV